MIGCFSWDQVFIHKQIFEPKVNNEWSIEKLINGVFFIDENIAKNASVLLIRTVVYNWQLTFKKVSF